MKTIESVASGFGTVAEEPWALVLAGGDGTRLQELTRLIAGRPIPKQYCRLMGGRSLLEETFARVRKIIPRERTLVIVNHDHLGLAREQLVAIPSANVVVQPTNRETGPGLLLSLLALAERAPRATVAVFPSDHYVGNDAAFLPEVGRAIDLVDRLADKVVLLGIRPDGPEPGYGYVEPGASLVGESAYSVTAFREKPTRSLARRLVQRGALWNSFVMVFRVDRLLALLEAARPADVADMRALRAVPGDLTAGYSSVGRWNFSTDFLARFPEHLVVLPVADSAWSDWGTPQAIARTLDARREPPRLSLAAHDETLRFSLAELALMCVSLQGGVSA